MDATLLIALVAIGVEVIGLLTAAAWAVSAIRNTTSELSVAIKHLETTVSKLAKTIEVIQDKSLDHEIRIAILEKQTEHRDS